MNSVPDAAAIHDDLLNRFEQEPPGSPARAILLGQIRALEAAELDELPDVALAELHRESVQRTAQLQAAMDRRP